MKALSAHERQIYREIKERDQHRCQFPVLAQGVPSGEKCGRHDHWAGMDCHHRKQRSAKGETTAENLIYLCHEHHMWCHDNIAIARDLGLIVCEGDDPERMPWMDQKIPEDRFFFSDEDAAWSGAGEDAPTFSEAGDCPW